MAACRDIGYVLTSSHGCAPRHLAEWPALPIDRRVGVVLLVSLHAELKDPQYMEQAHALVQM